MLGAFRRLKATGIDVLAEIWFAVVLWCCLAGLAEWDAMRWADSHGVQGIIVDEGRE